MGAGTEAVAGGVNGRHMDMIHCLNVNPRLVLDEWWQHTERAAIARKAVEGDLDDSTDAVWRGRQRHGALGAASGWERRRVGGAGVVDHGGGSLRGVSSVIARDRRFPTLLAVLDWAPTRASTAAEARAKSVTSCISTARKLLLFRFRFVWRVICQRID